MPERALPASVPGEKRGDRDHDEVNGVVATGASQGDGPRESQQEGILVDCECREHCAPELAV